MFTLISDIVSLHKSSGNISDAYYKLHIDDKIFNLNIFTLKLSIISSGKKELNIWQEKINEEIKKDKNLEKEIKEFQSVFELLKKCKIRSGLISKNESPDFILNKNNKKIGIEITKIYVGYDWMAEKISEEIKEYRFNKDDIEGYIEYKKAGDKLDIYNSGKAIIISPKIFPLMNNEYNVMIKNKILEKIRKLFDDYEKFDENYIFAEITSPEYFEDITDLDSFTNEIRYYLAHLEQFESYGSYKLIIKLNQKWISIDLSNGSYNMI